MENSHKNILKTKNFVDKPNNCDSIRCKKGDNSEKF